MCSKVSPHEDGVTDLVRLSPRIKKKGFDTKKYIPCAHSTYTFFVNCAPMPAKKWQRYYDTYLFLAMIGTAYFGCGGGNERKHVPDPCGIASRSTPKILFSYPHHHSMTYMDMHRWSPVSMKKPLFWQPRSIGLDFVTNIRNSIIGMGRAWYGFCFVAWFRSAEKELLSSYMTEVSSVYLYIETVQIRHCQGIHASTLPTNWYGTSSIV